MLNWFRSGAPWIWLTGGAVSISLLAVLGLLTLIGWKGLNYFWPEPVYQWTLLEAPVAHQTLPLKVGERIVGQLYQKSRYRLPNSLSRGKPWRRERISSHV